ncbi:MAG: hypothetical protein ACREOH_12535 [Candidatus Entotheonellia bacterium]
MEDTPKRPYERPTLVATTLFGAEAGMGTCCRVTTAQCGASRTVQAGSVDPNKTRPNITS